MAHKMSQLVISFLQGMEEPDEMESTTLDGQSGGFSETTTEHDGDLIQLVRRPYVGPVLAFN